ncbi:MAG: chemotaxis protein CheX [Candidatus Sulfotelmatobacter sp.]
MKTPNEMLSENASVHEGWSTVLEMAVREVFELMLGCQLTPGKAPPEQALDVTAMVGLAGKLCGVISIQCSAKSSAIMASKMLGIEPEKIGPEMCDAFGEICNMIAGNFKNKIAGLSEGCLLSVPTVITGNDYSLHSLTDAPALELRLQFEGAPVVVSLQILN